MGVGWLDSRICIRSAVCRGFSLFVCALLSDSTTSQAPENIVNGKYHRRIFMMTSCGRKEPMLVGRLAIGEFITAWHGLLRFGF
jgi:hypothetical protein